MVHQIFAKIITLLGTIDRNIFGTHKNSPKILTAPF